MQKIFELLSENDLLNYSHLNSIRNNNNSELLFLQKKRNFETSIFHNKWSHMYPKKEVNFSIERENEKKIETKNSFKALETLSKTSNPLERSLINDINNYSNEIKNFGKMENLFKKLINLNNENHNINLEESDKNNLNIQQKNEFLRNEKLDSNNLIITDNKINNKEEKKNNIFKVMNKNNADNKSKIKKNDEKILINNKYVYAYPNEIDLFPYSNIYRNPKKIIFVGVGKRSSKYRGVSKNGNQWQVLIMVNKSKTYIGTYSSESIAARIYDIIAIKNRGIKARTNFVYSNNQLTKICNNDIDIKAKNINEVIYKLLKED
jgi:hypothetical protein